MRLLGIPRPLVAASLVSALLVPVATARADVTERVSLNATNGEGNGASYAGGVSADGRAIVFSSSASNLVAGDTNGRGDVFVRDRPAGTIERVSIGGNGEQGIEDSAWPAISADGRFAAFSATFDLGELFDAGVFVRDRSIGTTEKVTFLNGFAAALSGDGRFVAFAGDDVNGVIIVVDRETGAIAYFPSRGFSPPALSADGRFVAYMSTSTDRTGEPNGFPDGLVVADVQSRAVEPVAQSFFLAGPPALSADGRFVAFETDVSTLVLGDTNEQSDIFVHDRETGATARVSVDGNGGQADGASLDAALSGDGRFVAFTSYASNLVPGDTNEEPDVFIHDRQTGATERVSIDSAGAQANGASTSPELNADGSTVAFSSAASNLVSGDTNGVSDAFVRVTSTPESRLEDLIDTVAALALPPGLQRDLTRQLQLALAALRDPAESPCQPLRTFLRKVRHHRGWKLTRDEAAQLTAAAREIASGVGCT